MKKNIESEKYKSEKYLNKYNEILKVKSMPERHFRLFDLVSQWLHDSDAKKELSDGFIQHLYGGILFSDLDECKPSIDILKVFESYNIR